MSNRNIFIWYDSKQKLYQSGTLEELESLRSKVKGKYSIQVVYEFHDSSVSVINKLLYSLNSAQHPDQ
ncbi:MAG: hypothetical protein RLO17_10265 [Cyclobacteriaceae bacterium]